MKSLTLEGRKRRWRVAARFLVVRDARHLDYLVVVAVVGGEVDELSAHGCGRRIGGATVGVVLGFMLGRIVVKRPLHLCSLSLRETSQGGSGPWTACGVDGLKNHE